jgi:hypothetical protein
MMPKQKPKIECPSKRCRTLLKRNQLSGKRLVSNHLNRLQEYARNYTATIIMADVARRLGSPTVSPRDFYCGCAPCYKDGLPMCERKRPDCRYANRSRPENLAARETEWDKYRYDINWSIVTTYFNGPAMPRSFWDRRRKEKPQDGSNRPA